MKEIRINFSNAPWIAGVDDFLRCFPYLRGLYQFVQANDPDYVFYGPYNYHHKWNERAVRIICAGEPGSHFHQAKTRQGDPGHFEDGWFHFGLTECARTNHPNHRYFPLPCLMLPFYTGQGISALVRRPEELTIGLPGGAPVPEKQHFCNFIYSNGRSPDRIEFFDVLSRYKRVEAPAQVRHNCGGLGPSYPDKQRFQASCKFSIAMENTYAPGYVTEKLSDPFLARSVPIYRGDPDVARFFNPDAFINLADFRNNDEAIEFIKMVDRDDALYARYLREPPFRGNVVPEEISDGYYLKFWEQVFGPAETA